MKVFLDTNVLISAFIARGLCADLLRLVLAEHRLLTGAVNLDELERVLRDRFAATPAEIALALAVFEDEMVVPRPAAILSVRVRDKADAWVLASAVAAGADLLVSGDKDLLTVATRAPVPIVTPREAWERLRGRTGAT
ncbi:MAG: putative toxin-antitoxin system toxin component, PIN family [Gemmatimonadaceae bacterium]